MQYPLHLGMYINSNVTIKVSKFYSRTKWVKANGQEYRIDAGVVYGVEHDLPLVGKIEDIQIVDGNKVLFHFKPYLTSYELHLHTYLLYKNVDLHEKVLYLSSLFLEIPVQICTSQVLELVSFIILPYTLCTM